MKPYKPLIIGLLTLIIVAVSGMSASAYSNADPYDGVNRIGTYYQYTYRAPLAQTQMYNSYYTYDYIAPARAGGWFGSGTEWLVGLRSPVYTPVPPVRYTNYYVPTCGWPCYTGGNGYWPMRASESPYRERYGGIFRY